MLDITNASDLVTVSWNVFRNHDKVMLIGSSDSALTDAGKLRVTLHHNVFEALGQRVPRVRFDGSRCKAYPKGTRSKFSRNDGYGYRWAEVGTERFYLQGNAMTTVAVRPTQNSRLPRPASRSADRVVPVQRNVATPQTLDNASSMRKLRGLYAPTRTPQIRHNVAWIEARHSAAPPRAARDERARAQRASAWFGE